MDRRLLFSSSRESSSHHQQSQPPLSAEELLKNILLRGSGTTNNPVTTIPLPSKLFSILANKELEHIVSWLPQGRAWRIHNVEMFAQRLLPLFCNNNIGPSSVNKNLRAFTSQLEAWGFRELSRGPNSLAYYSELFVREAPEIHQLMRPTTTTQQSSSSPRCVLQHRQTLVDQAAAIERCCNNERRTPLPSAGADKTMIPVVEALTALKASTQTRNHHHGDLALLARAASNKASSSAATTQILENPSRNYNTPTAAQRRPGPLMDLPPREESLAQLELQMSEALRVAKELHDRSIMHLRQARRIADSSSTTTATMNNSCSMSPYATMAADVSNQHPTKSDNHFSAQTSMGRLLATSSPTMFATTKSTSPPGKKSSNMVEGITTVAGIHKPNKKKNRKKWLPPLGPPTPSISATFLPSVTSSSSRSLCLSSLSPSNNNNNNRSCSNTTSASNNSGATNTTTNNNNMYDWYYTNPEVFATLSNKARIQP